MQLYPPDYYANEKSFILAWENVIKFCLKNGYKIETEYGQESLDICSKITMSGLAINQIKNRQIHNKFPTRGLHLVEYINQFTPEFDSNKFTYTYYDRLTKYPVADGIVKYEINQLENIKENLKNSRRLQAITWIPYIDNELEHCPCLQRLWLRVLENPDYEFGIKKKGMVELHLSWRSRDLFSAWASNLVAIVFMVYNEILKNEYELVKIVDIIDSAHIYKSDWHQAGNI